MIFSAETPDNLSDGELFLLAAEGNRDAAFQLSANLHLPALQIATRMLSSYPNAIDLADQAVQEAWYSAYKSVSQYDASKKFSSWFFTIVTRKCRNEFRYLHTERNNTDRTKYIADMEDQDGEKPFELQLVMDRGGQQAHEQQMQDLRERLDALIPDANLSPRELAVLQLRREGLDYHEIAHKTDSAGYKAVSVSITRVVRKLQNACKQTISN